MSLNEAARYTWLAVAVVALTVHGLGIYLLLKLSKKTVSDYLLMFLSISDVAKVLVRLSFTVYCFTQMSCQRYMDIYMAALITCLMAEILSLTLITLDRLMKVMFTFKYGFLITNKSLLWASLPFTIVCLGHGMIPLIHPKPRLAATYIVLAWDVMLCFTFIVCYLYIFICLRRSRREVSKGNGSVSRRPSFKLKVPASIAGTFIAFCIFPNFLLAAGVIPFSPWQMFTQSPR